MAKDTFIARVRKARRDYEKSMQGARKEIAKALGKLMPKGFILEWDQYTPSFNDGDPCRFRVGTASVGTTVIPVEYLESEDGEEQKSVELPLEGNEDYAEREDPLCDYSDAGVLDDLEYGDLGELAWCGFPEKQLKKLQKAFGELPKDLLESAFGDPVRVRIYSGGRLIVEDIDPPY